MLKLTESFKPVAGGMEVRRLRGPGSLIQPPALLRPAWGREGTAATGSGTRLLSCNLLHGSGAETDDVARLVEKHKPDVVLMQEAGTRLDTLQQRLGGHYARRQMGHREHGPAVWSSHQLEDLETIALPRATRFDPDFPNRRRSLGSAGSCK